MTRHHAGHEHEWTRQVWLDGGRVVAWGWVKPPARLFWEAAPSSVNEVFAWFEANADARPLEVSVRAGNHAAVAALEARGFAHDLDAPWIRHNVRDLEDLPEPEVPDGYRLATMAELDDVESRVAAHRSAFHPSRVTVESYLRVMAEWPYRPELDCVAVAPDGSVASYALGWIDAANAAGLLEPVGTHADHRRRGLARAACLHALHGLRAAGATTALVGSRGDDAYPVPRLLYESVGFRELTRSLVYTKTS